MTKQQIIDQINMDNTDEEVVAELTAVMAKSLKKQLQPISRQKLLEKTTNY